MPTPDVMRRTRRAWPRLVVASLLAANTCASAAVLDRFIDPADGMFDLSSGASERKTFLPVPIVISEPAVGYGGGAAILFFHEAEGDTADAPARVRKPPPDILGVGAFLTENGTKGAAAGGQWTFRDDRYRYRGGVGDFTIKLDFYGVGDRLPIPVEKIGYTLKGLGSFQQAMMRLGNSDTFVAVRWIYLDLDTQLGVPAANAGLSGKQIAGRSSGLGVAIEHDSRDNIFTPGRGVLAAAEGTFYDEAFGSSNRFETYRAHVFDYVPIARRWTLGLRGDVRLARGDVPFYMLPFIELRGIPAARFQDRNVAVLETEVRYDVDERWSLVGFAGAGKAWGRDTFSDASAPASGGAGLRYLIARRLGLYVGLDYAKSRVADTVYIQIGSAWR
jgi:hypothetical protein